MNFQQANSNASKNRNAITVSEKGILSKLDFPII